MIFIQKLTLNNSPQLKYLFVLKSKDKNQTQQEKVHKSKINKKLTWMVQTQSNRSQMKINRFWNQNKIVN